MSQATSPSRPSTRSALLTSRTMAMRDLSRSVSLEIDPDTASQERKYPSIRDYYQSNVFDNSKPIQLQKGLSNYSCVVLGDDRIAFSESILSATYRVAVEEKLAIESPSKAKTKHSRRREYEEAQSKVGDVEINRLEKVMKDKLIQRSYITSSPFQVRKAFKFFDQEQIMRIHIEGFTRALEFLGFQFADLQNLALFGRYDTECTGDIDYMNFIKTAMFYPSNYTGQDFRREVPHPVTEVNSVSSEEKEARKNELRTIFNKLDKSKSGSISRDQFDLLLMALRVNVPDYQADLFWRDMGMPTGEPLPFELFFEWWTSDVGRAYVPLVVQETPASRAAHSRGAHK